MRCALAVLLLAVLGAGLAEPARRGKGRQAAVRRTRPAVGRASTKRPAEAAEAIARRMAKLEGVENAAGLAPFFDRLRALELGGGVVRVLQYGDSHTASDDWANAARTALQAEFGDGGPGFTFAARPYRGYRRYDVKTQSSGNWRTFGLPRREGDGRYGLGGLAVEASVETEWAEVSARVERAELLYGRQPGGGAFEVSVNAADAETVATAGSPGTGVWATAETGQVEEASTAVQESPPSTFRVRAVGDGPVRLFGWMLENRRGLTWETLGINGAQATGVLTWNDALLAEQLERRDVALIVLAYGTNEAIRPGFSAEAYRDEYREVVRRFRAASPQAAILVIGPPDSQMRAKRRAWVPYPHTSAVRDAQREVALAEGCAFWDWRARMGGPGTVRQWVQAGLAQPDHVHLTGAGYRLLGGMLARDLMDLHRAHSSARGE